MIIVDKPIEQLIPYEKNARNNTQSVDKVAKSIKKFGFRVPIVIDKDNVIVAGHTRHAAAKKLGMKEVPCIVADDLTENQIKAYRLADNRVAEFSLWDFQLLNEELESIADIDMGDFGFEIKFNDDDIVVDQEEETQVNVNPASPGTGEIDAEQYDDEQFAHICPRCKFRFNE
jgi:site-specific DNA-methyltransferase (adenine-specific)|nr:MAG TPA: ParB protein [Caudoviricetes sp.]